MPIARSDRIGDAQKDCDAAKKATKQDEKERANHHESLLRG
jgi:hypothetical protein